MGERIVKKGYCGMCRSQCAICATVEDGKIVALAPDTDSPYGRLCARGALAKSVIYGQERLLEPLIRTGERGEGTFRKATWEEALDLTAQKLQQIRETYGPAALASYFGQGVLEDSIRKAGQTFFRHYESPNFLACNSICNKVSFEIVPISTFGIPKGKIKADIKNSDVIFVWGKNPVTDDGPDKVAQKILDRQKEGAKLVVVDPRKKGMGEHADLWIPIVPGTDGALFTAMLKELVEQECYDREFAENYTQGFAEYKAYLEGVSIPEMLKLCGVSREQFEELFRLFCSSEKASLISYTGLEYQYSGVQNTRAMWTLWALSGKLDVCGGMVFDENAYPTRKVTLPELSPMPVGSEDFPLFTAFTGNGQVSRLPQTILSGNPYPVRAMMVVGGSPIVTFPNAPLWKKAYSSLDFMVVFDRYMTEEAKYADVILPVTTWFENASITNRRGRNIYREPFIEPVGGTRSDIFILQALAERLGFGHVLPRNNEELYLWAVDGDTERLEKLRKKATGPKPISSVYKKYQSGALRKDGQPGFPTPSGKFEIDSTVIRQAGYEGIRVYHDIREVIPAEGFPYMMTTGARSGVRMSSFGQNIPEMAKVEPVPLVELSPAMAEENKIADGTPVRVATPFGSCIFTAKVLDMAPGAIHIPYGGGSSFMNEAWAKGNVNELCSLDYCDPISGYACIKSIPCRLEPVQV